MCACAHACSYLLMPSSICWCCCFCVLQDQIHWLPLGKQDPFSHTFWSKKNITAEGISIFLTCRANWIFIHDFRIALFLIGLYFGLYVLWYKLSNTQLFIHMDGCDLIRILSIRSDQQRSVETSKTELTLQCVASSGFQGRNKIRDFTCPRLSMHVL